MLKANFLRKFWFRVSHWGVNSDTSFDHARRVILLNRLAMVLFAFVFTMRTLLIVLGMQELSVQGIIPFFAMLIIWSIPYFNKLGYYKYNSFVFTIISPLLLLIFSTLSQQSNEIVNINHYYFPRFTLMGFLVLPLVLIDTKDKLLMLIAVGINLLCQLSFDFAVALLGKPFALESVSFSGMETIRFLIMIPSVFAILAFIFLRNLNERYEQQIVRLNSSLQQKNSDLEQFNEEIRSQRDQIIRKNEELEQSNEEIIVQRDTIAEKNELLEDISTKIELVHRDLTDSINYAENIQRAVLLEEHIPDGYFQDSFIYLNAKSHVSGDFYYYKPIVINGKHAMVVAAVDCTGHGVPGGFLSMLAITQLNEVLLCSNLHDAADVLNFLRDRIKSILMQGNQLSVNRDGMDMSLCIYYPQTKVADFAGARNPVCVISDKGELQVIKTDRQPIGAHLIEKPFTNFRMQMAPNDMVYLFSDGLQDQFGGERGKKLKFSELKQLFASMAPQSCKSQKYRISTFLSEWRNPFPGVKYEQVDDIVVVGFRV